MFGPDGRLVGVLTTPGQTPDRPLPAVVILNAGVIHRVGPGRLHVRLARQLAAAGHAVLRFDLAGIGESALHPGAMEYAQTVLDDCRHAVDLVAGSGAESVVIFGLCSGADNGFKVACADERVAGLILIDPTVPATRGYRLRWWTRKIVNPVAWRNLIVGRSDVLALFEAESAHRRSAAAAADAGGSLAQATMGMQEIVGRGVSICCVFTGGQDYCNYRKQLLDAFPRVDFGSQLQLEYWPDSTHVFLAEPDKLKLLATIRDWMVDRGFTTTARADAARQGGS